MQTAMSKSEKWQYTGEYLQACNCDWGCPCNVGARPTMGFCEGGFAVNVTTGKHDSTKLDGAKFAFFAKWPGQIHEGGGTAGIWIDEKATKGQKDALVRIITGKAGGLPWSILAATVEKWLEPRFVPFEWKFDGVHSRFKAGQAVHATLEPIRNPVTGEEGRASILLPDGFIFKEGEIASLRAFAVFDQGIKYAHPGKNAHVATVNHSS